jgi:hypothetical protein
MAARIRLTRRPPPMASKASVALVARSASVRSSKNVPEQLGLRHRAHDVDQRDLLLDAEPVEHLAQVGCCGGVHQGGMALRPHGLDDPQHGHRVDERRRPVRGQGPGGQLQARGDVDAPVLRVHGAAGHGHHPAEQGLGGV